MNCCAYDAWLYRERHLIRCFIGKMSEASQIKQMIEMTASVLADMGGSWQQSSDEDK